MTSSTAADDVATIKPSAIVTGASRGIGYAIAQHLARQGWNLTLNARQPDRLEQVKAEFIALGTNVRVLASDAADQSTAQRLVELHAEAFQTLNALILGAGIGTASPIDGYPMRRFDLQVAVNLRAPFELVSRALPLLRAGVDADPERGGRIIALASVEGTYPDHDLSAYGATKAGVLSLVRSVNIEERATGVTASAISPAYVATDMTDWLSDKIPGDAMIQVGDIVKVVDTILTVSRNAVLPHVIINRRGASPYEA